MTKLDLSIVIPTRNEEDSVIPLYKEISTTLKKLNKSYEIIFINDGSTDNTGKRLSSIKNKNKNVKVITFRKRYSNRIGKSEALQAGFEKATGEIVITMDADLQDNPKEIPNFLAKLNEGYDLVSGWKKKRHDPLTKKFPSQIGNFVVGFLTGVKIHDMNCGFKAYRNEVVKSLNLYGELYKFIPVLTSKNDFRITEIPVDHRARKFGRSKFSWERNTKGFLDLITVVFLTTYLRRPAHFFGSLGLISFGIGFVIGIYITYLRLTTGSIQFRHPLLFLGMLLMIIGIQLITTGLVGELLVSLTRPNHPNRKP